MLRNYKPHIKPHLFWLCSRLKLKIQISFLRCNGPRTFFIDRRPLAVTFTYQTKLRWTKVPKNWHRAKNIIRRNILSIKIELNTFNRKILAFMVISSSAMSSWSSAENNIGGQNCQNVDNCAKILSEICKYGSKNGRKYVWVGGFFHFWPAHPLHFSNQIPPPGMIACTNSISNWKS